MTEARQSTLYLAAEEFFALRPSLSILEICGTASAMPETFATGSQWTGVAIVVFQVDHPKIPLQPH